MAAPPPFYRGTALVRTRPVGACGSVCAYRHHVVRAWLGRVEKRLGGFFHLT